MIITTLNNFFAIFFFNVELLAVFFHLFSSTLYKIDYIYNFYLFNYNNNFCSVHVNSKTLLTHLRFTNISPLEFSSSVSLRIHRTNLPPPPPPPSKIYVLHREATFQILVIYCNTGDIPCNAIPLPQTNKSFIHLFTFPMHHP